MCIDSNSCKSWPKREKRIVYHILHKKYKRVGEANVLFFQLCSFIVPINKLLIIFILYFVYLLNLIRNTVRHS